MWHQPTGDNVAATMRGRASAAGHPTRAELDRSAVRPTYPAIRDAAGAFDGRMFWDTGRCSHVRPNRRLGRPPPSGRKPVSIPREQRHFADVGDGSQPRDPALKSDREATMGGHSVPEGFEVALERIKVLAI